MTSRLLCWTDEAWADYVYWQGQDKKTLRRINKLIAEVKRSPFEGIGKPEPLKENLAGFWSRRIDETNRWHRQARASEGKSGRLLVPPDRRDQPLGLRGGRYRHYRDFLSLSLLMTSFMIPGSPSAM